MQYHVTMALSIVNLPLEAIAKKVSMVTWRSLWRLFDLKTTGLGLYSERQGRALPIFNTESEILHILLMTSVAHIALIAALLLNP
jgi:hypothetical protein